MTPISLRHAYLTAKAHVCARGFGHEIRWQDERTLEQLTEQRFLREAAWVVLSSGMRETVIRAKFSAFSTAFLDWRSATDIAGDRHGCATRARRVFAHHGKIDAILTIAEHVRTNGIESVRERTLSHGVTFLQEFPYLGKATSYHLAKNLGVDVAKPDRHLVRIARATGFDSAHELCSAIAAGVADKSSVIDLVLWRFATITKDYLSHFRAVAA